MGSTTLNIEQIEFFNTNGYLVIENLISQDQIKTYRDIYNRFLNGEIETGKNRVDLGVGLGKNTQVENITQIMWPCDFVPELLDMEYHQRALSMSKALFGNDMELDFDMLINKAPGTNTPTPWHQDAAYWITLPDKRAVSCWLALDEATIDNGCMWYVPKSHLQPLRVHRPMSVKGGALVCDADEEEGIPIQIKPGTGIFHHGATLHYSRGNATSSQRRAFIINFRPKAMIDLERQAGFDHGRTGSAAERQVRNEHSK
ncbi:phytanoyl-CoA dioxygenase family protein [Parapedobacter indicus]|uniref:Ectoine hydroxylase-related dioxygenase, phytanoyl-CoA dioxygenase (PhyH) family n=1 Tax=Parapedobacter indicus TaxID=1477437 RepID=A0A1I3GPE2_9SPHI|nr:phytanoyl-CoA dioxygenase family protein [Parapedobacter indicus]PPL02734.1 ectoine hydroxylase-related dioxygenase (phytanoyl-CoA dioxygenase family) [Parapedobacter indicus]SFI25367.1 Ectoine hydroxylase-related dioxygenase, phytanoyl-CoA dioxygenase (PhyH) family [Parapedobacter indicus]